MTRPSHSLSMDDDGQMDGWTTDDGLTTTTITTTTTTKEGRSILQARWWPIEHQQKRRSLSMDDGWTTTTITTKERQSTVTAGENTKAIGCPIENEEKRLANQSTS